MSKDSYRWSDLFRPDFWFVQEELSNLDYSSSQEKKDCPGEDQSTDIGSSFSYPIR